MDTQKFIATVGDVFDASIRKIARKMEKGKLHASGPFSYPTTLRIAETPDHFIAELCGGRDAGHVTQMRLQRPNVAEKAQDATTFFNGGFDGGDPERALVIVGECSHVGNLTITSPYDRETFLQKVNFPLNDTVIKGQRSDTPLGIRTTAKRLLFFNLNIVRTEQFRVVFRSILTAICITKTSTSHDLRKWLEIECDKSIKQHKPLVLNLKSGPSPYNFGRELCSLSDQPVTEAVLDEFIQSHGEHFKKALKYRAFLSQPVLRWIDRTDDEPHESIPDYLLQREDGDWDILDLKRALLRFKSIVRGLPGRPRFIDYVHEMAAQLVEYRNYFSKPENARWAEANLGIHVSDIRVIGVVGNYDTFDSKQVERAMPLYAEKITVISYSDIVDLLRKFDTDR